jgi:type I restriction enzyme M protein
MASPLTVKRNDYLSHPKESAVYTPNGVSRFLYETLCNAHPLRSRSGPSAGGGRCLPTFYFVLDPAIGTGHLTAPWLHGHPQHYIYGCDIHARGKEYCHQFYHGRYEDQADMGRPDLVLCNPPFNGAAGRKLYPEVFLAHTFKLFGPETPTVLFAPMGMRLNQRRKSTRWRWLRDCGAKLSSIVSLPLDTFPDVEFHAEILIFNVKGIAPHYFLPEKALYD